MYKNTAIYSIQNILLTPYLESENKPKGSILSIGIPTFFIGQNLYSFIEKKDVIPGQKILFPVIFQAFIDSLLFKNFNSIFFDLFLVINTMIIDAAI